MENISLSKEKISSIEVENTNYGTNFETLTNKSPAVFKQVKSVKYSENYVNSHDKTKSNMSFNFSPPNNKTQISTMRNENRVTNATMSPRTLNFKKRKDNKSVFSGRDISDSKRNKFNIKEVVYSDASDAYK